MPINNIFCFTVTRAASVARTATLAKTITEARNTAGCDFDWFIWTAGCSGAALAMINGKVKSGAVTGVIHNEDNIGQHVAWNAAYEMAKKAGYKYFLRLDDDCTFITKRWLRKLVDASARLDDRIVLAPTVRGLKSTPFGSSVVEVSGLPLKFLVEAIGGVCRLHPVELIDGFVADVRKPLGSGDATGIAAWCREHTPIIPFAYTQHIRVKHATLLQEAEDAAHFETHSVFQYIPYIPAWSPEEHAENSSAEQS